MEFALAEAPIQFARYSVTVAQCDNTVLVSPFHDRDGGDRPTTGRSFQVPAGKPACNNTTGAAEQVKQIADELKIQKKLLQAGPRL